MQQPIHIASLWGQKNVVHTLIKNYSILPTSQSKVHKSYNHCLIIFIIINFIQNGLTPIHDAAHRGHEAIVEMLVDEFKVDSSSQSNVNQKTTCIYNNFITCVLGRVPANSQCLL